MLLTVDVGNTNITFGLFKGEELKYSFRMMTKQPRTSDEYGVSVMMLLQQMDVKKKKWKAS